MSFTLSLIAAALYSVSSALLSRTLTKPWRAGPATGNGNATPSSTNIDGNPVGEASQNYSARYRRLTLAFAVVAVVIHGWIMINQTGLPHHLSLPLFTALATTMLTIALLHIVLCLRQPADYLGLAVYPLAAVSLIASQAAGNAAQIVGDAVQIHVLLSLVAYGVLSLAAAQAVLVAIQRHYLSNHKPGGFVRSLPPLDTTEQLLFTLLLVGFVLLSLALASGFFYLEDMFGQRLVHKTVLSCLAWAVFGTLLFGRWRFGWRGKKAVHWALGGFAMLVMAYFGTKFVIEVLLS